MKIFGLISIQMMMSVIGGPPQGPALKGGIAQNREEKLHNSVRLESPVGKITMIKSRDGKHSNDVERNGGVNRSPAPADNERRQAHQVH